MHKKYTEKYININCTTISAVWTYIKYLSAAKMKGLELEELKKLFRWKL